MLSAVQRVSYNITKHKTKAAINSYPIVCITLRENYLSDYTTKEKHQFFCYVAELVNVGVLHTTQKKNISLDYIISKNVNFQFMLHWSVFKMTSTVLTVQFWRLKESFLPFW